MIENSKNKRNTSSRLLENDLDLPLTAIAGRGHDFCGTRGRIFLFNLNKNLRYDKFFFHFLFIYISLNLLSILMALLLFT